MSKGNTITKGIRLRKSVRPPRRASSS